MTKRKKSKVTNRCQWCGLRFPTATEHMIHVTTEHAHTIGRGRTMSKGWSCDNPNCDAINPPVVHECVDCGRSNPGVWASNKLRRFVIVRKRPDGTISRSKAMGYKTAHEAMTVLPSIITHLANAGDPTSTYPGPVTYNAPRHEVWCGRTQVAWLEVATVTATPNNPATTRS